jgi:foldase protein PrsA
MRWNSIGKRGLKIAGALALILFGLALMPLLALPYGGLDWRMYDPAYKGSYGFVAPPEPTGVVVEIPCAELPRLGELLAALVNDQGIRLEAFEREMAQFLIALAASGTDLQSDQVQAEMPLYRQQILDLMIDDVLVQQAAVEMDTTVTDQEIQTRVAEEVAVGGGIEPFQTWLEETGQTWEELNRDVCQDLLNQAIFERVTSEITGTMDMVWARQIVVATQAESMLILTRLASGEPFENVAREVSLDEQTRDSGGDLGWFPVGKGWMPLEIEVAAFAGAPGQVQGPILVGERYVIVQTIEREENRTLDPGTLDALRVTAFERWLAGRRAAAGIKIFVDLEAKPE